MPVEEMGQIGLFNLVNGTVLPLGCLVLVDEQGAHSLIELSVVEEAGRNLELHLKAFFDRKFGTALQLLKHNSHAEGRHWREHFLGLVGEVSV